MDVLTHLIEKGQRCPNCGVREDEWNEKMGGSREAYAPYAHRCHTCELVAYEADSFRTSGGDTKGITIRLEKKNVPPAAPPLMGISVKP